MESSRIVLEKYKACDQEDFLTLVSTPDVMAFVDGVLSYDIANKLFNSFLEDSLEDDVWAVRQKESGEYIGHAALTVTDRDSTREILFYLLPKYWGKGFATEIGTQLIDFAKANEKLKQIEATLDLDHIASQKVCENIGLDFIEKGADDEGEFLIYQLTLDAR